MSDRSLIRAILALLLGSTLVTPSAAAFPGGSGSPALDIPCPLPTVSDRCPAWTDRYDHPGGHGDGLSADVAVATAIAPDGDRAYVGGYSRDDAEGLDALVIAYDLDTGDRLWTHRYSGPAGLSDTIRSVAASLDGHRVYVAGTRDGDTNGNADFLTLALDATTGERLWVSNYDNGASDFGMGLAVGPGHVDDDRPGADRLYVVGQSEQVSGDMDGAAVAVDGLTGETLWSYRYGEAAGLLPFDTLSAVTVDPAGGRVVVVGTTYNDETFAFDGLAIALDTGIHQRDDHARGGAELWRSRRERSSGYLAQFGPDGDRLYWAGVAWRSGGVSLGLPSTDYLTVALDADGSEVWSDRWSGFGVNEGENIVADMALAPGGHHVYVTGVASGLAEGDDDFGTLAYDAATGERAWISQHGTPGHVGDVPLAIGVAPEGGRVYVAGVSGATPIRPLLVSNAAVFVPVSVTAPRADGVVLALDANSGAGSWVGRYNASETGDESTYGMDLAVGADHVLVAGWTQRSVDRADDDPLDGRANRVDLLATVFARE